MWSKGDALDKICKVSVEIYWCITIERQQAQYTLCPRLHKVLSKFWGSNRPQEATDVWCPGNWPKLPSNAQIFAGNLVYREHVLQTVHQTCPPDSGDCDLLWHPTSLCQCITCNNHCDTHLYPCTLDRNSWIGILRWSGVLPHLEVKKEKLLQCGFRVFKLRVKLGILVVNTSNRRWVKKDFNDVLRSRYMHINSILIPILLSS